MSCLGKLRPIFKRLGRTGFSNSLAHPCLKEDLKVYSKDDNEVNTVEKVLRRAGAGLSLLISFFILRKVNTKFKNLLCTRRLFQEKWKDIIID